MVNLNGAHNSPEGRFYDIRVPETLPDFPDVAEKRAAAHRRVDEQYDNYMLAAWVHNEIARVQEEAGEVVPLREVLERKAEQ